MDETVRIVVEIKPSGKYSDSHCNLFQCCGSVIFWYGSGSADPYLWPVFRIHDIWFGSGSADPCLWLMDPDPNPAIFVIDLQDTNKKLIWKKSFPAYYSLRVHLHHFSKIKSPKEVTKQQESRFFLLLLLDDRRIRIRSHTSGSERHKNIWIRWIRITASNSSIYKKSLKKGNISLLRKA